MAPPSERLRPEGRFFFLRVLPGQRLSDGKSITCPYSGCIRVRLHPAIREPVSTWIAQQKAAIYVLISPT